MFEIQWSICTILRKIIKEVFVSSTPLTNFIEIYAFLGSKIPHLSEEIQEQAHTAKWVTDL